MCLEPNPSPPPTRARAEDKCPGPKSFSDREHYFDDHVTPEGLISHLELFFGHSWPPRLIRNYGYQAIMDTLGDLTSKYGEKLDRVDPVAAAKNPYGQADPIIKNPAGFLENALKERNG
jgi:hypothetical protein